MTGYGAGAEHSCGGGATPEAPVEVQEVQEEEVEVEVEEEEEEEVEVEEEEEEVVEEGGLREARRGHAPK